MQIVKNEKINNLIEGLFIVVILIIVTLIVLALALGLLAVLSIFVGKYIVAPVIISLI